MSVENIIQYLLLVSKSTVFSIMILLGPLVLLAFIIHYISSVNEKLSYKLWGIKGYLYIFGWLGTAVHELGHAFFALLFFHKINEIKLFSSKGHGGTLGYVSHSYNKRNIYHRIGNFFIGIGPILFGAMVMLLAVFLLFKINFNELPGVHIRFDKLDNQYLKSILSEASLGFNYFYQIIFHSQFVFWKVAVLIYVLYCVGSSITLSPSDIKGALSGFLFFVVVLFAFNLLTIWHDNYSIRFANFVNTYLSVIYFLIIVSIIVNLSFIIMLLFLNFIKSLFVR